MLYCHILLLSPSTPYVTIANNFNPKKMGMLYSWATPIQSTTINKYFTPHLFDEFDSVLPITIIY